MLKEKCSGCAKKIDRKFNFCPWCGQSRKAHKEEENFGLLGSTDTTDNMNQPVNQQELPFGLNKIMNGLIKQLKIPQGFYSLRDCVSFQKSAFV